MVPICVYLFSAGPRSKPCLVHSPIGPIGPRCSDCHQVWWRKLLTSLKLSLSIGARGSSKTSSKAQKFLLEALGLQFMSSCSSQVQLKFQELQPITLLFVTFSFSRNTFFVRLLAFSGTVLTPLFECRRVQWFKTLRSLRSRSPSCFAGE